jgi:hypothetical protein
MSMTRMARVAALVCVCLAGPALAQTPNGGEFVVNAVTTDSQNFPSAAMDRNGDFVVVWDSWQDDGSARGVVARLFSAAGAPKGPGFVVNAYTTGIQGRPAVACDSRGYFVVTWFSNQDGSSYGIRQRRFDSQGQPLGGGMAVNTYTTGYQTMPHVAVSSGGRYVVAWESTDEDGSGTGIFARTYDAGGTPLGPPVAVNTYTTGNQSHPRMAIDENGQIWIAYQSQGEDGSGYAILAQKVFGTGILGNRLYVNTSTLGDQMYPSIAMNGGGAFVVAWSSQYGDGNSPGVRARLYDDVGVPLGPEFQVNTYTTGEQGGPQVTMDDAGTFVVIWSSSGQDGDGNGVFGQRFDAAGNKVGTEFPVNTYTTAGQVTPVVAGNPDGDFVVAWGGPSADIEDILGQRYGDLIFQDDFESGDFSRWSSSVTDGGDLAISTGLTGTIRGLSAVVDDTEPMYVQDDSPSAESRYRARFYLDPDTLDPGEASGHLRVRVMIAFNGSSQRQVTVVLRRIGGAYGVMCRVRRDDGTRMDTGFFAISNAPHFVEIDWEQATAPGALDGRFRMRIDDAVVSTLTGIDNDASGGIEFTRLGLMVVKDGASGTAAFDQFESRRQRHIGPEWP